MPLGFTLALSVIGFIREILGNGTLLGFRVLGAWFEPWAIMVHPPGGFLTMGILLTRARPHPLGEGGRMIADLVWIFASACLINNFTLTYFLGL